MGERLSIGEFARASGLSVSALRFYDSAGLIVPAEVDPGNGYRHYDADQLAEAELVRDLRRLEMPLAAIPEFLAAGPDIRRKTLNDHLYHLSKRARELQLIAGQVRSAINQEEDSMTTMTVDGAEFRQALDQVLPAVGNDPERPTLFTVLIEAREGSLRLVATDSYRLAVRDLVARAGPEASFRAVVAGAGLARIRPSLEEAGDIALSLEGPKLALATPDGPIELRTVPAEFPAYEGLFGADPAASVLTIDRAALVQTLERALGTAVVRLELTAAGLRVLTDPPTNLVAVYQGPDMTVGLNPLFAHYAASSALGPELRIEFTDSLKPVVFKSATDGSYICLLMPIKLE